MPRRSGTNRHRLPRAALLIIILAGGLVGCEAAPADPAAAVSGEASHLSQEGASPEGTAAAGEIPASPLPPGPGSAASGGSGSDSSSGAAPDQDRHPDADGEEAAAGTGSLALHPTGEAENPDGTAAAGAVPAGGTGAEGAAPALPGGVAVIVENSAAARPQSGLEQADWVYEAEAEGGITRFLALFYRHEASAIGPVRSARTYFVELAAPWGVPLAHAGGNASALREIEAWELPHLDGLRGAGEPYFWRSADRQMPHNLYTSTERLLAGIRAMGLPLRPVEASARGPAPPDGRRVAEVVLRYGPDYTVRYRWTGKGWRRYLDQEPHTMASGAVPEPANLLILAPPGHWVPVKHEVDPIELVLDWQAGGDALLLREGQVWTGHWEKGSDRAPLVFRLDGDPWPLAPGPTWVQIMHSLDDVSLIGPSGTTEEEP